MEIFHQKVNDCAPSDCSSKVMALDEGVFFVYLLSNIFHGCYKYYQSKQHLLGHYPLIKTYGTIGLILRLFSRLLSVLKNQQQTNNAFDI